MVNSISYPFSVGVDGGDWVRGGGGGGLGCSSGVHFEQSHPDPPKKCPIVSGTSIWMVVTEGVVCGHFMSRLHMLDYIEYFFHTWK